MNWTEQKRFNNVSTHLPPHICFIVLQVACLSSEMLICIRLEELLYQVRSGLETNAGLLWMKEHWLQLAPRERKERCIELWWEKVARAEGKKFLFFSPKVRTCWLVLHTGIGQGARKNGEKKASRSWANENFIRNSFSSLKRNPLSPQFSIWGWKQFWSRTRWYAQAFPYQQFANKESAFSTGTELGKAFSISPKCEGSGSPHPHSARSTIGKLSEACVQVTCLFAQAAYVYQYWLFLR